MPMKKYKPEQIVTLRHGFHLELDQAKRLKEHRSSNVVVPVNPRSPQQQSNTG